MSRLRIGAWLLPFLAVAMPAEAQLTDPGQRDQFVSGSLVRTARATSLQAAVSSQDDIPLPMLEHLSFAWQLDFGTLNQKRSTPTGTVLLREADVSRNSGQAVLSYATTAVRAGQQWRWSVDGGIEVKRSQASAASDIKDKLTGIGSLRGRMLGARLLGTDANRAPELAWLVQVGAVAGSGINPDGTESSQIFAEPAAVVWFSFWSTQFQNPGDKEPKLLYRLRARGELAAVQSFSEADRRRGHWSASLTYFFNSRNGLELRHFQGYFDHNLRDRKDVTAVAFVWFLT